MLNIEGFFFFFNLKPKKLEVFFCNIVYAITVA